MTHAALLKVSLARDSRTDRLLASVNFATEAFDRRLDAAGVLKASMRSEMLHETATSGNPPSPHALKTSALQSAICEIWDTEAGKRRLHKLA